MLCIYTEKYLKYNLKRILIDKIGFITDCECVFPFGILNIA